MDTPPVIEKKEQKLVTIYLDNFSYGKGKMLLTGFADKHGMVEEHLATELAQGWRIASLNAFGGCADLAARGWIIVVLER